MNLTLFLSGYAFGAATVLLTIWLWLRRYDRMASIINTVRNCYERERKERQD